MYKTSYKTIYRIHSTEEAMEFPIGKSTTDMLLWMIDIYDVLLSINQKVLDKPSVNTIIDLRIKCTDYFLQHYHELYRPIPGVMLGWTPSMLLYIIILHLVNLQYDGGNMWLSQELKDYVKQHRLRMFQDPDPSTWCFATFVSMMDVLSLRWKGLDVSKELDELLEMMWRLSAKFILSIHSKIKLNVDNYNEDVKGKENHARLSEQGIIISMSRFYWFSSSLNYYRRWPLARTAVVTVEASNWSKWILNERRHFVTRRFRDSISTYLWDKIILYGDNEISSHSQLGEKVSNFTCLYARWPAGLLNKLQKILTYEEYETIIQFLPIKPWVHLMMINQHFVNMYNVKWLNFFFVSEESMHKHIEGIERSLVPVVLYRFNGFDVFYQGKVYQHPQSRNIEHAFLLWCHLLRVKCDGKAFDSMDFNELLQNLLDQEVVVDNSREVSGMFELEDD